MKIISNSVSGNCIEITLQAPEGAEGTAIITYKLKKGFIEKYEIFDVLFNRRNYNFKQEVFNFLDKNLNKKYLNKILKSNEKWVKSN